MTGEGINQGGNKPIPTLANELTGLIIAYVKQETVVPIKSLGRFIAFGILGALFLAVGGGLLTLAAVRAVQAETGSHLRGDFTWVPYTGGLIVAGVGAAWAATRIRKGTK